MNFRDEQFGIVLLLLPKYHLIEKTERIKAFSDGHFNENWKKEGYRKKLQKSISIVESNDDLISISPRIMAIARKNDNCHRR